MYADSQTSFIGQLNDKFFIAKRSYILESGFFLTFSAFSPSTAVRKLSAVSAEV